MSDYFTEPQETIPFLDEYESPYPGSATRLGPEEDEDYPEDDDIDPGCW